MLEVQFIAEGFIRASVGKEDEWLLPAQAANEAIQERAETPEKSLTELVFSDFPLDFFS